jgi:hypothetical protein
LFGWFLKKMIYLEISGNYLIGLLIFNYLIFKYL